MDILGGRPFSLRPPSRHKKLEDSYLLTWKDVFEAANVKSERFEYAQVCVYQPTSNQLPSFLS